MKPKKINAKLFLNKKTVANLSNTEQSRVKGGTGTQEGCEQSLGTICYFSECLTHCMSRPVDTCDTCTCGCNKISHPLICLTIGDLCF
jgi:hypothetical protein